MAKKTPEQVVEIIRDLTVKVKNGVLSSAEAEKRAILALQEVEEADMAQGADEQAADEEIGIPEESAEPTPPVGDPKTKILSLLTRLEEAIEVSLKKFEKEITDILKGTAGAAVPLGDFSIGGGQHSGKQESSAKLTIEQGDKPTLATINYLLKRNWSVDGLQMPVTGNFVKPRACNVPLRQEMLELCSSVRDNTSSELAWKKGKKLPLEQVAKIEALAKDTGDYRVLEIIENKPADAYAESWKKWAVAGQVYLLGTDFSADKGFSAVKQGL